MVLTVTCYLCMSQWFHSLGRENHVEVGKSMTSFETLDLEAAA